jgi:DNA-binding IscR family transcriptional regulator
MRPPADVSVADIIRAVEGPLAAGGAPDVPEPPALRRGSNDALRAVWSVLRANERAVLESVTLADLASGRLPDTSAMRRLTDA